MSNRKVILCFIEFYYPGNKSGGPVRSIENFVSYFCHEFDIKIVCRDRDICDKIPYPGVQIDSWNVVGSAEVFYASNKWISLKGIVQLLNKTQYDVLYLNSFFCYGFTILPLLAKWLGMAEKRVCVIAPRGELAKEALQLKLLKKLCYLYFAKNVGLYNRLLWQASSEEELKDIHREKIVGVGKVMIAPDLLQMKVMDATAVINNASLKSGSLRVIFLSRISPIKNLDFLLATLSSINLPIELNIYGPYENETYWVYCQELISNLPQNITVNIHGPIMHSQIQEIFSKYDLFAFPTKGENFGHVIFESLSAGTPVIVSDKTPWRPSSSGGLLSLPLEQGIWRHAIMQRLSYTKEELSELRLDAISYASTYLASDQSIKKNRELFLSVLDDNYKNHLV